MWVLIGVIIFNIQMTFTSTSQKICPNAYAMECESDLIDICDIGRVTYQHQSQKNGRWYRNSSVADFSGSSLGQRNHQYLIISKRQNPLNILQLNERIAAGRLILRFLASTSSALCEPVLRTAGNFCQARFRPFFNVGR